MFIFHLIFLGFTLIVSIIQSFGGNDCNIKNPFLGTCLALTLVFIVSAFFVMYNNLYFALKFINLGSNIVWTAFWLQSSFCNNIFVTTIGFIHGLLSIVGLVGFIIMNLLRKNTVTAKSWKQIYIVSIVLMLFCFVVSFIGEGSANSCGPAKMFLLTYQKFGAL